MTAIPQWSSRIMVLCASALLLSQVAPAAAQDKAPPSPPEVAALPAPEPEVESFDLRTTKRLLGDFGGARTAMEDAGFKFTFILGNTTSINFRGGLNTKNTINNGSRVFYIFETDFEKMGLVEGGSFYVRLLQEWGDGLRDDLGSLTHPYYLIASGGEVSFDLDKWWYKQTLFDGRLEFRLGKLLNIVDLLDRNAYAANYLNQFSNQVFNYNSTIPAARALGAYLKVQPTDWLYFLTMAVDPYFSQTSCSHGFNGFDTAFGDDAHFLGFWEIGATAKFKSANGELPGTYRAGWWYDPRTKKVIFDDLGGLRATQEESGDVGFYVNFDQMVWKENDDAADKQGLGVFGRYGYAHADVNAVSHFWSAGASYLGPIPSRDEDVLGFGVAQSMMSKELREEVNSLADRETVYELFYAIKVAPWCVITPDLQVITNPGGDKNARDALIGGVRVKIVF
ncbi:MAG: carbohydrate porin [bacterium]|nr:carbohydrate porin [bacterium]